MRNTLLTILSIGTLTLLASCSKDDGLRDPSVQNLTNTIVTDTWRVTSFIDGDDGDETNLFTDYTFTFCRCGTVTATRNGTNYTGSWYTELDNKQLELELDFEDNNNPLNELDEDWDVIEITENRIQLQDLDDDDDNDDEYLTLERI